MHPTKQRLIDAGLPLLLEHGYADLGVQGVLEATGVPKGSFYHHFADKEDFALQVVDAYMRSVHAALDATLGDLETPPLARVRAFFEGVQERYRDEGYMGCLLGGLGQELAAVNDTFRRRIERCFVEIAERLAVCLEEAQAAGDLRPGFDARELADRLVDCWEGAALRSRLRSDPEPLTAMLDFYFTAAGAGRASGTRSR